MSEIDLIICDAHNTLIEPLFTNFKIKKFYCLGDFSQKIQNIYFLKQISENTNIFSKIVAGNHEDCLYKGINFESDFFNNSDESFEYLHKTIKKNFYLNTFLQNLVEKEEQMLKNNELNTHFTGQSKIMITHGCPIITEPTFYGSNPVLWSRLFDFEKGFFITNKINEVFKLLEINNLHGIYRAHDHLPSLHVKKNSDIFTYAEFGTFITKNNEEYLKDLNKIQDLEILVKNDEKFIFNPGPFNEGYVGFVKSCEKGLKFYVKNISLLLNNK